MINLKIGLVCSGSGDVGGDVNVPSNLPIWPICQSQIAQLICKWGDQSEIFLKYCFQTHTVLSHTLFLLELMVSTKVSRIE